MFDAISEALQNQFLSGGIVLMLTASVIALCRKLPIQIWNWFLRRVTIVVDVSNDDPLFAWLSLWLAEHPYSLRARTLTATSERDDYGRAISGPSSGTSELPQVLFTPAPGNHPLWYKRRLVWLSRDRKEAAPGKDESLMSAWKREVFTIRLIGRNQSATRALLEDARSVALRRRQRKIEVFSASYESWQSIDERDPRPLTSIFLPDGTIESIEKDVSTFLGSQSSFFPDARSADGFGDRVVALGLSMCDVQNHLIDNKDSCVRALNSLTKAA